MELPKGETVVVFHVVFQKHVLNFMPHRLHLSRSSTLDVLTREPVVIQIICHFLKLLHLVRNSLVLATLHQVELREGITLLLGVVGVSNKLAVCLRVTGHIFKGFFVLLIGFHKGHMLLNQLVGKRTLDQLLHELPVTKVCFHALLNIQ